MSISLGAHFKAFVARAVKSCHCKSSSEVVRAAVAEGVAELDAGKGKPFDAARIKAEGRKRSLVEKG